MFDFSILASAAGFFQGLLGVVLFLVSFFLVFIILIQRGKGGGIAGSLTGTAQSAFGARGGDTLMWLTLSLTVIWILLCCVTIYFYSRVDSGQLIEGGGDVATGTLDPSSDSGTSIAPSIEELLNNSEGDNTDKIEDSPAPSDDSDQDQPAALSDSETEPSSEGTEPDGTSTDVNPNPAEVDSGDAPSETDKDE